MVIPFTAAEGVWQGVDCRPPTGGGRLEKVTLTVDPAHAFRVFRVRRQSDGEVLANGGWTPARDRPLQIFPATDWVGPDDLVRMEACTWGATACEGRLTWTP